MSLHRCHLCPYAAPSKGCLQTHMRVHTGERPYRCHVCAMTFTQNGNLTRHLQVHTGSRKYKCPVCDFASKRKETLKVHMGRHAEQRPLLLYSCHLCPAQLSTPADIRHHYTTHHNLVNKPTDAHGACANSDSEGHSSLDRDLESREISDDRQGMRSQLEVQTDRQCHENCGQSGHCDGHSPWEKKHSPRSNSPRSLDLRIKQERPDSDSEYEDNLVIDESIKNDVTATDKQRRLSGRSEHYSTDHNRLLERHNSQISRKPDDDNEVMNLSLGNLISPQSPRHLPIPTTVKRFKTELSTGIDSEPDQAMPSTVTKIQSAGTFWPEGGTWQPLSGGQMITQQREQRERRLSNSSAVSASSVTSSLHNTLHMMLPESRPPRVELERQRSHHQVAPQSPINMSTLLSLTAAPKQYLCTTCDIMFGDHVMYTIHMGCHGFRNPLECNVCGYLSRDKYEFSSHLVRGEHGVNRN